MLRILHACGGAAAGVASAGLLTVVYAAKRHGLIFPSELRHGLYALVGASVCLLVTSHLLSRRLGSIAPRAGAVTVGAASVAFIAVLVFGLPWLLLGQIAERDCRSGLDGAYGVLGTCGAAGLSLGGDLVLLLPRSEEACELDVRSCELEADFTACGRWYVHGCEGRLSMPTCDFADGTVQPEWEACLRAAARRGAVRPRSYCARLLDRCERDRGL